MIPWRNNDECLLTVTPEPQLGALGRLALGTHKDVFLRTEWQSRPSAAALGLYRLLRDRITIEQLLQAMTDSPDTPTNTLGLFANIGSWLQIQRLQASAFYLGDMPVMERIFGAVAPPVWATNVRQLDQLIALAICPDARNTRFWHQLDDQGLNIDTLTGLRACERLRASLQLAFENVDRVASLWRNRRNVATLQQNAHELWATTRTLRVALRHHNPLEGDRPMQQVWNKAELMELAPWISLGNGPLPQRMRFGRLYAFYTRRGEEITWFIYSGGPLYGQPLQLREMIWTHPDRMPMATERGIWKANETTRALYFLNAPDVDLHQEDIFWRDRAGVRITVEYGESHGR